MVFASCLSASFKTHGYFWSALFEEFILLIICLNLQMNFFTYASVLLILVQQDIFSSTVCNILQFLVPIAFTVTSFLTSGHSSFSGYKSALIIYYDSCF